MRKIGKENGDVEENIRIDEKMLLERMGDIEKLIRESEEPLNYEKFRKAAYAIAAACERKLEAGKQEKKSFMPPFGNWKNNKDAFAIGKSPKKIDDEETKKRRKEDLEKQIKEQEEKLLSEAREGYMLAMEALEREKLVYEAYEKTEELYEETVNSLLSPFKKAMENLIFFAGCKSPEDYEYREAELNNKRNDLLAGLQEGMWGEKINEAALSRIDEMFSVTVSHAAVQWMMSDHLEGQRDIQAWHQEREKAEKKTELYREENRKYAVRMKTKEQIWEYVNLLKALYPVLEKVQQGPQETRESQWAVEIAASLRAIVEQHDCKNPNMHFLWIDRQDPQFLKHEKIRIDFVAAEADCPGLYYEEKDSGKLVCVVPGRIFVKE